MLPTAVASIDVEPLDLPLTEPFAIAGGAPSVAHNVLVRLRLADGAEGLGEAAPFTAVSGETQAGTLASIRDLQPALLRRDARGWRSLGAELRARAEGAPAARAGLEMALLDALARHQGVPLWSFFGGRSTELATDMTITAGDEPHAASSARAILQRGIGTIKVKTGAASPEEDVRRVLAVHRAAPGARLCVDANAGYDLVAAQRFLDGLAQHGVRLALLEQPLPRGDDAGWSALSASSSVPLCADESARSVADVHALAARRHARYVNIKVTKSGVAESLAMMEAARALGLGLMIGGMVESILAMSFSASLAAGFGGFDFVDLDTPMFIARHPFEGGFAQEGERLSVAHVLRGHGVRLK